MIQEESFTPNRTPVITPSIQRILTQMGEQIRLARLRRDLPTSLVAERAGISRQTLAAIEKGSASVSMGAYARTLHALQGLDQDLLLIARDDALGRQIQDEKLGKRASRVSRKDG